MDEPDNSVQEFAQFLRKKWPDAGWKILEEGYLTLQGRRVRVVASKLYADINAAGEADAPLRFEAFGEDDSASTRSRTLRIRLTEDERAGLDEAAERAGQSRSEYARRKLFK